MSTGTPAQQTQPAPFTYTRDNILIMRVTKDEGLILGDGSVLVDDGGVVHDLITQLLVIKENEKLAAIQEAYAQGYGEGATHGTLNAMRKSAQAARR